MLWSADQVSCQLDQTNCLNGWTDGRMNKNFNRKRVKDLSQGLTLQEDNNLQKIICPITIEMLTSETIDDRIV